MGIDDLEMAEKSTKFYAESTTEWQLRLIVWEFFCTLTWSGRARSCGRKRRTHVTRWLRYWARTVRPGTFRCAGAARLRDSMGKGRDRRIATLPHFDFTIPGAIDQSEYVFRDEEHGSTEWHRFACMILMRRAM